MGYFQVRYDSRAVNYDRRGFIRLATGREELYRMQLIPDGDQRNFLFFKSDFRFGARDKD